MRVYLESFGRYASSMKIQPQQITTACRDKYPPFDDGGWYITLHGTNEDTISFYGTVKELQSLIKGLDLALEDIKKKEGSHD